MAAKQIPLSRILPAIDRKDRDFYDTLDDDEKKAFSGFLLVRYASAISGSPDLQHYYLGNTNKCANKYMFDFYSHPKLQWLMLTTVSPGMGNMNHNWIKQKPKPKGSGTAVRKQLADLHPAMKDTDLDLLSTFITKKELTQYAKDCGNTKT